MILSDSEQGCKKIVLSCDPLGNDPLSPTHVTFPDLKTAFRIALSYGLINKLLNTFLQYKSNFNFKKSHEQNFMNKNTTKHTNITTGDVT